MKLKTLYIYTCIHMNDRIGSQKSDCEIVFRKSKKCVEAERAACPRQARMMLARR